MDYTIIAQSIHKIYRTGFFNKKSTYALKGVDLSVKEGEIFGLLGPNGAGKTTLLNVFSCQLIPDQGRVWILGEEITNHVTNQLKSRLNMCSGNPNFPWSMTVWENLKFYSLLYGLYGKDCRKRIDDCMEMFELEKFRNTRYDELSTGTKQKLALAKSLINNPEVLFLDEPTIGLDPDIAKKIRELIKRIHQTNKITVILTTHYMKEAEELCDRIAFIRDGQIKLIGTKDQITDKTGTQNLEEAFLELAD